MGKGPEGFGEPEDDSAILAELDLGLESTPLEPDPHALVRNAPRHQLTLEFGRALTAADIAALSLPRPKPATSPTALVRIHASHHSLARCLATGMKQSQAALVTGYSAGRISVLLQDETFRALVAEYQSEAKSAFGDIAERMTGISLDALEVLHDRLQDKPTEFSIPMLLDVVKTFADRTGHGPGQDVHIKVDRDFIDRPPRETFEEWQNRRAIELVPPEPEIKRSLALGGADVRYKEATVLDIMDKLPPKGGEVK